jgi:hypothetical protein
MGVDRIIGGAAMEWSYDARARCWRFTIGGWAARVERWPASLEYLAEIISPAPARRAVQAPHVFDDRTAAQAWCIRAIAGQGEG